jgi:putative membrane protein insertion efficiency factor
MIFKKWSILFFMTLLLTAASYGEEGPGEEPWPNEISRGSLKEKSPGSLTSPGRQVAIGLLRFYQKYISPVDGERCPSYPTCSQYGLEAVRKHGALWGLVLTFDRLIHESDEVRIAPLIRVGDSYRCYDPVENNDFWWYKR